ncbi:matrixin family metalloprotease [Acinetobacter sp. ABJ_C5_2]|uniref:matrixin family metalloprotease n=1 Tax=Acinetobacter sp. ABJ_C5_2 TaxID=3376992 RepID=UPI0037C980D1
MKKFLWWGISFYLSMSLYTVAFAQSHLSTISFNQPLKYKIDYIDPRFHITKEQFIQIGQEAAGIWQKEAGKTYFIYDPQAELTINLVFDDYQAVQNEKKININKLLQQQEELREKNKTVLLSKQQIDQETALLNEAKEELNNRFEQYQKDVTLFNQGDNSKFNQADLIKRQAELTELSLKLKTKFSQHNNKIENLNAQIKQINQQQSLLSQSIKQFNLSTTASPETFHKGLFSQNQIQIYGFNSFDDLRLTLAHEFGHALGLKHTTDPKSLMYPRLKEQDIHNFKLTHSDLDLLGSFYSSNNENH